MILILLNAQIVPQVLNVAIHRKHLWNVLMALIVKSKAVNVFNVQQGKGICFLFATLLIYNIILHAIVDNNVLYFSFFSILVTVYD